jgi:hypothetical protein
VLPALPAALEAGLQRLHGVLHPAVAHVVDAVVTVAGVVELVDQVLHAFDVGAPVADDQGVGGGHRRQVRVLRQQRANQWDQFADGGLLHLQQACFQGIGAAQVDVVAVLRLGLGIRHDARLVAFGEHRVAVGGHHREEQLIDLGKAERCLGNNADLTLDAGVEDQGQAADAGDLLDEVIDIGITHVDGPALLSLFGADRTGQTEQDHAQRDGTQCYHAIHG